MRYALILLALLASALWPADGRAEKRVALVVGNAAYTHVPKLANPRNDAAAMADLLRRAGFDVVDARNDLASLDFKRAVREFANAVRDADIAVVYYAGHGIEIGGLNYLIPTDARLATDIDAEDEAVSLDRIVRLLEPAKRLRLVILDACRDNPFVGGMRRSIASRAVSRGLAQVEPATSDTLIAFAAKAGSTADDGDNGANSPFTAALLKHITVPGLDVRLALGRVRDEVRGRTSNKQEPFVYGSLGGATVALVPEPKVQAAPGPAPAVNPVADPARDYELAERVGTQAAWDSFLAVHKTGFYADLARAARAKLAAATPTAPAPPPARPVAPSIEVVPPAPPAAQTPLPASDIAARPPETREPAVDPKELRRKLQAELDRVGCDPGEVDGNWGGQSRNAMRLFNRHAGTRFDIEGASVEALEAVRAKTARICPLVCGRGQRAEGDNCAAIREPAPRPEPEARPASKPKREPVARREPPTPREVAPEPRPPRIRATREARPAASRGPSSPLCQSFFSQGGRRCCTYDPPGGAPRIICD